MKSISVTIIRIALVWLLVGTTTGTWMLLNRAGVVGAGIWIFRPSHIDTMLLGFMIQFALGVALWILPRARHAANRKPANDGWAAALFNVGLVLRIVASMSGPSAASQSSFYIGTGILAAGLGLLVWKLWPRIQSIEKLTAH